MTEENEAVTTPIDSYSAFISHSSKDVEVAQEVCAHLEERGLRCWIAPRNVRPGRNYGAEIVRGIERSKCLVLILSDDSNASRPVKDEVECAYRKGKPVFPLRIEEVPPSPALEFFISSSHWIDAWTGDMTQHVERLAEGLTGHDKDAPFKVTGRQIRRKLATVGLAWPIIAGIAVLGLVIAVWRLGSGPADHVGEMPDFQELQDQIMESLPEDQARVMEDFDPDLITADVIGLNVQGQPGYGWGVTLEIPSWFYGRFDFRGNVSKLMFSTDGKRYAPGVTIQNFMLPAGTDIDRVWVKFVLRDGKETNPIVFDLDLGQVHMEAAEQALGQYPGPRSCSIRFDQPACSVMDGGLQTSAGPALKSVRISENQSFDGNVVDLYWPGGERELISYSPAPDAQEFFVQAELTNGAQSAIHRVSVQSRDWPHWTRLDGKRQSGDKRFDRAGMRVLYAAFEPRKSWPSWKFWGPTLDCRRNSPRFAFDDKGMLPVDCRSDSLLVNSPGESGEIWVEYSHDQLGSAVYRYQVDYLDLAARSMRDGIEDLQNYLNCSQSGGSAPKLSCYWNDDARWRLPVVKRLEYGPAPDDLSGSTDVELGLDAVLDMNNTQRRMYRRGEEALSVEAQWRDVFARLVLEDGTRTEPQRMAVR